MKLAYRDYGLFRRPRMVVIVMTMLCAGSLPALAAANPCDLPLSGAKSWLPITPKPSETAPPPPHPASDCGFYRPAWQRFLFVMQPSPTNPAFLSYPGLSDLFAPAGASRPPDRMMSLVPRNREQPNSPKDGTSPSLPDINQAGLQGVLIDQRGHPVYYGIHANPEFRSFLTAHKLNSLPGINSLKPDDTLKFSAGLVELKSAWMVVDGPQVAPTYFITRALVPHYTVDAASGLLKQAIDAHGHPRQETVWVALMALHVAFTLPGHPEMVWSTFEHVHLDSAGNSTRDNAPAAAQNPSKTPIDAVISTTNFPLYKAGTKASEANLAIDPKVMAQHFDEATQSFTKGGLLQTSVYRPYPGSKTDGPPPAAGEPDPSAEDSDVILINNNATALFAAQRASGKLRQPDYRENYRLVGAVWIDRPERDFVHTNTGYAVDIDHTTDQEGEVLAGEGRLAATVIESFTQSEDSSPSCFACHDTHRVTRDVANTPLLPPNFLNVSHILSKFKELQSTTP